jgi:hypothetical protein
VPRARNNATDVDDGRYGAVFSKPLGHGVSYSDVDPEVLFRCVNAVTLAGDAITFGRTSDGGAYYVGLLSGGVLHRSYLDSAGQLLARLRDISEAAEALVE